MLNISISPVWATVLVILTIAVIGAHVGLLVRRVRSTLGGVFAALTGLLIILLLGILMFIISGVIFNTNPGPAAPAQDHYPASNPSPATPAQDPCPTTADAKLATGVDVQRLATEACAFVWRGTPPATISAVCPTGYVCTWDVVGDIVVVQLGVNQTAMIRAGTWRYIAAYPPTDAVSDVCNLYKKEQAFGSSEAPSFNVRFQPVTDSALRPIGPQTCP